MVSVRRSPFAWHCRQAALVGLATIALGACVTPKPAAPPTLKTVTEARYEAVDFGSLPSIAAADLVKAWPALLTSCRVLARRAEWAPLCRAAGQADPTDPEQLRSLVTTHLQPWRIRSVTREDTSADPAAEPRVVSVTDRGRMTGYYEPELAGSRTRVPPFVYPLYRVPDDLLTIDLSALYPELAHKRVRGRLDGKRVVPYWSRAEIEGKARLAGDELLWVDDEIDAFFLQVQGSGRVRLPDGSTVRVGYADVNGHPYQSIGRILVERGELKLEDASLAGIRAWAQAHPQRIGELLDQNPSYVFFRELPLGDPTAGPVGAMSVPLTPGYSVAVDRRFVPLGSPVVIDSVDPASGAPLVRMVLAQDVGGAIRGPLRFDFFWGLGRAAGEKAGRQRHDVQAWLLLPKGSTPAQLLAP